MELKMLGYDEWFMEGLENAQRPDCVPARVTAVDRDSYLVRNELAEVPAELAGIFRFSAESRLDLPCVGDWALVQYHNGGTFAIIHAVLPRKSFLRRKTAGKSIDIQPIAANIDVAFILQSCDLNFNLRRLERYLVMANDGLVEPRLLLTKADLVSLQERERLISLARECRIECPILPLSSKTDVGQDELRAMLKPGRTYCLLGSSGVGKTTLLNYLVGRELFATSDVRDFDGKGRHTTARRQLIVLDQGAMLVDTPGMREFGTIGMSRGIDESFSDLAELSMGCRFANCTHTTESGCSILARLNSGQLSQARYESYMKLRSESEFHDMSYLERRRKDRAFGRFIKSAKKHRGG
jgi:ribosome biogenesis GTPase